jgi:hypothetical protein
MSSELTNLLPSEKTKAFRREYFVRLLTTVVIVLMVLLIAQMVFLLPSYLYEREIVSARSAELQALSANSATAQEQQARTQLAALKTGATLLLMLGKVPTASTALRAVLAVPRPGITLSGFAYGQTGATTASSTRTLQLSGTASTRETLRAYDSALGALPFVSNADLPISDYAKDSQIPFTITLTGSLAP